MSFPSELRNHPTPIVDIEGSTLHLRLLLKQVTSNIPPKLESWTAAHAVAQLGERYQFDHLPWILAQTIQPCLETHPVQVFIFASQHDFETLAKSAIGKFNRDTGWNGLHMRDLRQSWLAGAKVEYVVALFVAMRSTESNTETADWRKVAGAFEIQR